MRTLKEQLYDLTNPQKAIWYTEQYMQGTSVGNICGTLIMKEKVDFKKLEESMNILLKHNDSFRLQFKMEQTEPKQVLKEYSYLKIDPIILDKKEDLKELEREIVTKPFALLDSFLFRFVIFQFPDNTGGFIINAHHLIADAWSAGIIVNNIVDNYEKLLKNETPKTDFPSYLDYIGEEKKYHESAKYEKDKKYWLDMFEEVPDIAVIPSMQANKKLAVSYASVREEFILPKELIEKIQRLCTENKISIFNFFMAIYAIFVSRVCNLENFVIGTPILNRTNFVEKNTCGMFISTAPCAIEVKDGFTFVELAKKIAMDTVSLLRHQKYSYFEILEELRKKHKDMPGLYSVLFSYQNTRTNRRSAEIQYETRWTSNENTSDALDIHLYDMDDTDEMNLAYDYQTSRYSRNDILHINECINKIIQQVLERADILIGDLDIVSDKEKQVLKNSFNQERLTYEPKTAIDLILEQIKNNPDQIAVWAGDEKISYAKLNEKANKLAGEILKITEHKKGIIGVCLDKSISLIVSLLAILKTGNAYLPINPEYPNERIEYMLENSQALACITNFEKNMKTNNIALENLAWDKSENKEVYVPTTFEDIAYVIYTSGSTGKPKGILVKQENLINFIHSFNAQFENKFSNKDVCLSLTNISFDVSIAEIFMPLTHGSTLVLHQENSLNDINLLCDTIIEKKVSFLYIPPTILEEVYQRLVGKEVKINKLLVGVAPIQNKVLHKYKLLNPKIEIVNGYGPSETTICCTFYKYKGENDNKIIPIGRPLANNNIYILNNKKQLQPVGVVGEIYVSGKNVSKGYINNETLTNKSFQKDMFGLDRICYATGDMGYWDKEGILHFVGRDDNQVKFRGYRIELNEISYQLQIIKGVRNAVVQVKNIDEKSYLVAYVETELSVNELKRKLMKKLPFYMIPSHFIALDKFPLTVNGKVDIRALPDLKIIHRDRTMPANMTEEELYKIWTKILDNNEFGTKDSFFELGGDSLSAIRLIAEIENVFKVKLSIIEIYEAENIVELAKKIDQSKKEEILPMKKVGKKRHYPLSSAQKRIYYTDSMMDYKKLVYNVSGSILVDCILEEERVKKVFRKLIDRHEIFRTSFALVDGDIRQIVENKVYFNVKTSYDVQPDIEQMRNNFPQPFDLSKAPLLRVELHYIDNKQTLILIDSHHIVLDGTSLSILMQEFCDLYSGEELEKPNFEYVDYAFWENEYNQSEQIKKIETYWVNEFKDTDIPSINLPYDFPKSTKRSYVGNKVSIVLTEEMFNTLSQLAKELKVSNYMLFLAAFYVLLYKYTSQEEIIVGSPIASRYQKEIENMVGMFVNNMVLKTEISPTKTFVDYLAEVKKIVTEGLENQPYPYDRLVKKLNISTTSNNNPLFDVLFTYQNVPINEELTLEGHKVNLMEAKLPIAKFDLSLEIKPKNREIVLEYATDLFKKDTITDFLDNYKNTLQGILDNPNKKIKEIEILSKEEKNKILYEFNNNEEVHTEEELNVISLFEKNVQEQENHTAVIYNEDSLSYGELNRRANQLAHYLQREGLSKNSIVGVCMDKTLKFIVSILAIQKLGCAYMPIHPNYPAERVNYMLENSSCDYLLLDRTKADAECLHKINVENLDLEKEESANLDISILPEDIVYVIYTSGSTGKPKGILVSHRNLTNFIHSFNSCFDEKFGPEDKCLSLTNISFDVSICEIFTPLVLGATLVLYPHNTLTDIPLLYTILQKNKISFLYLPPSVLGDVYQFMSKQGNTTYIQKMLVGVEPIKNHTLNNFYKLNPKMEIINGYGPSETTICCTFFKHHKIRNANDTVPIGKPLKNNNIYILSKDKNLQPIGVSGEIYVSGVNVTKGYCNNPELTDKSYVKDPFYPERICFKTGDFGYWDNKGNIHFIGRQDEQVKVKGFRIELNEITTAIRAIPYVKSVITLVQNVNGINCICAYLTTTKKISKTYIREKLNAVLPFYMLPSYIIFLKEMPMTLNGKIDKKMLPLPSDFDIIRNENVCLPPKNEKEIILLELFKKILQKDAIGINHNFFEMGGDSLAAMRLQIEALSKGIYISYSDIFTYPTVEELADCIQLKDKPKETEQVEDLKKYDNLLSSNELKEGISLDKKSIGNVLLTGVTGFLGAHVLDSFVKQEKGIIYCLIRDKNNVPAEQRLRDTLHFYFGDMHDSEIGRRIQVVRGNVRDYELGLSEEEYEKLGNKINTVIHCAALVKHFGEYKEFEETNIKGTQKIVDLCEKFHLRLMHISTISVSGNVFADGSYVDNYFDKTIDYTEKNFYVGQNLENLYIKSKFEAEKVVLDAVSRGLEAYILRMGNLTNRYNEGKFQPNHFENAFVNRFRSILKLGCAPDYLLDMYTEFTPIDYAADAVIALANHYHKEFSVFHLLNDNNVTLDRLYETVKKFGISMEIVSHEEFVKKIDEILANPARKEDLNGIINDLDKDKKLVYDSSIHIKSDFSKDILGNIGFKWPYIDTDYLYKYFKYFADIGYFDLKL